VISCISDDNDDDEIIDKSNRLGSAVPPAAGLKVKRLRSEKQIESTNKSVVHALQRASSGKLAEVETAICLERGLRASEGGQALAAALVEENFTLLPPQSGSLRGLVTWHRLSLDLNAIAHSAAAKTSGTLAAASAAAAAADAVRAASADASVQEPFAAVVWSGEEYLRELTEGGTAGMEALVADVIRAVRAPPSSARCFVVFIVEGLQRALAAVDQRRGRVSAGAAASTRYVTSEAVENAHMHLYIHASLEIVETSSSSETAEHLLAMTRAIAEKPYKAKVSAFAHVLKKKTKAANFASITGLTGSSAALNPEATFWAAGGAVGLGEAAADGGLAASHSLLDTWLGALQMIPSMSEVKAVRVAAAYPTFRSLLSAFQGADKASAPFLLEVRR
jgi:hypothetical protein